MGRRGQRLAVVSAVLASGLVAGCSDARSGDAGRTVTVFGTLSDADVDAFEASVAPFERTSGIDVRYVGSSDFENDLFERLRRGDAPDIALLPQPGVLGSLVDEGLVLPWQDELADVAVSDVDPDLVALATRRGQVFGAWFQLNVKSLVWYSPKEFAERGLAVPTTWSELEALTAEAIDDGIAPWCIGIRDGAVTGWVATDWVEDLVLRFEGADVYDDWVDHDITFTDDRIVQSVERFGAIALDQSSVYGGNRAAVEYTIAGAAAQLVARPARCLLHRQSSTLPRLLDSALTYSPTGDLWAFPLPAVDGGDAPLVVGGTMAVRFADDADVDSVAEYLAGPDAASARAGLGEFVSPLESFPVDDYASALDRSVATLLREADVLRFDASDQMPPEVGVGAFWSAMSAYLGGARLRSVLAEVDAAWPGIEPRSVIVPGAASGDGDG